MKTILTLVLIFYCTGVYAVNSIDLFDQNRGQEKKSKPKVKKKNPSRKTKARKKKADFTLIGMSKIGEKHVIHFGTNKGKQDSFSWYEHQKSTSTKIYDSYEIDKIINRTLYLNIITDKPCVEDQKQGISCDKKNKQMVMQLVRKKAIISPQAARAKRKNTRNTKKKVEKKSERKPERKPFKWQQKR